MSRCQDPSLHCRATMTVWVRDLAAHSAAALLPHEKLDAFRVAIELVELVAALPTTRGASDVRDQLRRAATSAALNCAEACGKHGQDRARFFEIARGSALESAAASSSAPTPRSPSCRSSKATAEDGP